MHNFDFQIEMFINDVQKWPWKNTSEIKRRLKGNSDPRDVLKLIKEKRKSLPTRNTAG